MHWIGLEIKKALTRYKGLYVFLLFLLIGYVLRLLDLGIDMRGWMAGYAKWGMRGAGWVL